VVVLFRDESSVGIWVGTRWSSGHLDLNMQRYRGLVSKAMSEVEL
jgi:hypothetical protein